MNAAFSGSTSAAKEAGNFALSRNKKPSCAGSIGGTGAPGGGSLISDPTDSPLSGAKAACTCTTIKVAPFRLGRLHRLSDVSVLV
jgi:hypothetical protein